MIVFLLLPALYTAKDPISTPEDVTVGDDVTSSKLILPDSSTFSCNTGEASNVVCEYLFSSNIYTTNLSVSTIIATNSDILVSGNLEILGSVSYGYDTDENAAFLGSYLSFLEIPNTQWREIGVFSANDGRIEVKSLPLHSFVEVVGNSYCDQGDVIMKVDGQIEWMQPCRGTHHFRNIVDHTDSSLMIEFIGSQKTDVVTISTKSFSN
jgi:hypothetical protein